MNLIETAVRWRHGTFVLFCLLAIFGAVALFRLPLELQPGGDRPEISITTPYIGAAPSEVEDLVTRPIEEVLEEVEGVQEISSSSRAGLSSINIEFDWGTDVDARLVDVLNQLQQVEELPQEAGESSVRVASGDNSPMMWINLLPKNGSSANANSYRDLVEDIIEPRLQRVEGVSRFLIAGGQEREVEVRIDPKGLSDRNLTIGNVVDALRNANRDIRGGPLILGRREYRVRTVSRSQEIDQLEGIVLRRDSGGTVYLRDVAKVEMGRKFQDSFFLINDQPSVVIGVIRRIGANVPQVSQGVRQALKELEAQFDRNGQAITFGFNYDESLYIDQSVQLVQGNLISGALLATAVLLLFLGSMRSVAVVALTIPTTLVTVFIIMAAFGRSLNIISLAGLAFAVGMVVDNAIVVLENVFTHMQQGKTPMQASIEGTQEVWGAMLGSTLTTVVVFLPLVLVEGEAGQLFTDIGITLAGSVLLSLFAALTLVPMLCGLFLKQAEAQQMLQGGDYISGNWLELQVGRASAIFRFFQERLERMLAATAAWSIGQGKQSRRLIVLSIPVGLLVASIFLLPPADYLPEGNRNLVLWLTEPFPGTSVPEGLKLSADARAFLKQQPEIENTFMVYLPQFRAIGVTLKPENATSTGLAEIVNRLRGKSSTYPGYRFMFPTRRSIFNDPGKEFELQIVGPDLNQVEQLEKQITQKLRAFPGVANVRSDFVAGAPELQVIPNRERLAEVGLSETDLGTIVEAALGGRIASDFIEGKEELDVTVKLQNVFVETPEQLRQLSLYSNSLNSAPQLEASGASGGNTQSTTSQANNQGRQVQLADVAEVRETTGPDVINHVDLERSTTLTVSLTPEAPLGQLVERTENEILQPLQQNLPPNFRLELAGSADRLTETVTQLATVFILSLMITYLLLIALYRSFVYPLVIMATVPMGMSGALLSIVVANMIPGVNVPMDMITALGFVILTGVVVNNAILLVDRALQLQQDYGQEYDESLYNATRDRLRPIFMSAGTSVLGMLPLAVVPGQGAELYQGLGIALTGGLALSTILTPTVVPALMGLLRDFSGRKPPQATIVQEPEETASVSRTT
jgi:hydrophobic/amphiphilic exporter-1 (mainly G- bacteria), HAE1 family